MSITRVKSGGWATNEKLTSAQMSAVDANVEKALDKRSGQADALASNVTVASGGSLSFSSGSSLSAAASSTVTFSGVVTLETTSTVTFKANLTLQCSALTWDHSLGATNVTFGHVDNTTNGATGFNTTIAGHNCTGTTSTGGELILKSGTGTSLHGNVRLQAGSTTFLLANQNQINVQKRLAMVGATFTNAIVNVTFAAPSVILDLSLGNVFVLTAATANTGILPTNLQSGGVYTISYVQDGTGGWNVSWGGAFIFAGGISSLPDATANNRTIWRFLLVGTTFFALTRTVY